MNPIIIIRTAEPGDAGRVAELSAALGYPATRETMERRLKRLLESDDRTLLVAELNSEVVGWIEAAEQDLLVAGRRCEICGLVVDQQHRGAGIGRRLIDAAEQWARRRGLDEVSLRSNVIRPESHPFYEKIGYTRFKTQHAYRKRLRIEDPRL